MGNNCRRWVRFLAAPPLQVECLLWLVVLAAAIGIRIYLYHLVPVYIWSKDSSGYLGAATHWLDTGLWAPDARRGPIYSGFIAAVLWISHDLSAVVVAQHALGVVSIMMAALLVRYWFGRVCVWPLFLCTLSYATYSLPIYLEHLLRNESILLMLSTLMFAALALALERSSLGWTGWSGFFLGLLNLTKKVFAPFPIVVVLVLAWAGRRDWKRALFGIAIFLAAYLAPDAANTFHRRINMGMDDSGEYAGIQLYGRVAQWTHLDGGIFPEIKQEIAPLVREYRDRKRLDNNWVIKRGIVPRIADFQSRTEKSAESIDRICRQLAFEAIRTHPFLYAGQVSGDLFNILVKLGQGEKVPEDNTFPKMAEALREVVQPHPMLRRDEVARLYDSMAEADHKQKFSRYFQITQSSHLFESWPPVLMTTLMLPFVFWRSPSRRRCFWAAVACIWLFNLVLLSTVGKPMHRYLMPVTPIMFLCLTSAVVLAWRGMISTLEGWLPSSPASPHV